MTGEVAWALQALRAAMEADSELVSVTLQLPRPLARKLLRFLEAEDESGAVVIPVREQYTTTEAASILGVSRATLMKLIDSQAIEALKVGTHHRIPAEELLAYQRAQQVSRGRAAELATELAERSTRFHSNVTFSVIPQSKQGGHEGRDELS